MKYLKLTHITDKKQMIVMEDKIQAFKAIKTKQGKDAVAILYLDGNNDFVEETLEQIEMQLKQEK